MQQISHFKNFNGEVNYYQHSSAICQCLMTFSVYLPKQAKQQSCPAILWLSGLTCNHENFITKAGAQQYADKHGIILLMPDTSPRDVGIAAADVDYDVGYGAGFYLNATQAPWNKHFLMYDYLLQEFLPLCQQQFAIDANRISVMGHSMGGHGALVLALRNPGLFKSVSAFSPICAPSRVPWGQKAFRAYLGEDQTQWAQYDTVALIKQGAKQLPVRIEQGGADQFLQEQLKPELLLAACEQQNYQVDYHLRDGFDHSYYFIASFIAEHIAFHAEETGGS